MDLGFWPFMGVSLPYNVGMLDWEDFGILIHNFLSFNEKITMGSYFDAYPQNRNLDYQIILCSSYGG